MTIGLLIFRFAVLGVKSSSYSPFSFQLPCSSRLSFELTVVHFGVKTARRQQIDVIALFDNVPIVQYEDEIGILDRGKPVRDDKTRPAFHQRIHCLLDQDLRAGVNGAGRLVENQDLWIRQDDAGNRQ